MKIVRIAFFALTVAMAAHAHCGDIEPFALKGMPLGATLDDFSGKYPQIKCFEAKAGKRFLDCYSFHPPKHEELKSFAGMQAERFSFGFLDGRLGEVRVTLHSTAFDRVIASITEKYGAPTKAVQEQIKNRMGSTFTNDVVTWSRGGASFTVERYWGRLSRMSVWMREDDYVRAMVEQDNEQARAAAKDL